MKNEKIFHLAKEYLLSFEGVTEEIINRHLKDWNEGKPENLSEICKKMVSSAKNRGGMPNYIGDIEKLSKYVYDFDPHEISNYYSSWNELFDKIEQNYDPPGRMEKNNSKNAWVQFTKSIITISKFLMRFEDKEEFDNFVQNFNDNEETRAALPLLLQEEIFGFRFALACDFLKESGYPEYVKTDTHIKDIFVGLELTQEEEDFQIFKDVISYAESIDEKPYEVDKLFWLIGSGKFYLERDENGKKLKINTSKDEFIDMVEDKLNK